MMRTLASCRADINKPISGLSVPVPRFDSSRAVFDVLHCKQHSNRKNNHLNFLNTHLLDHKLGAFGRKQFSLSQLSQKKYQELGYYESQTLLMAAAKSKQTGDVLETIIELRADISVRSSNGSNVMFLARTPEQVHSTFDIRWLCRTVDGLGSI